MADDKSKRGPQDRSRIASGEQYEAKYFARKHRLPMADARAIIQQAGGSREKANQLAAARHH
jgi:hypothetical protein